MIRTRPRDRYFWPCLLHFILWICQETLPPANGCHPLAFLMGLGRSRGTWRSFQQGYGSLGQNIISINVENSPRVVRAAAPPVPALPFICLLSVIPGNADLRANRSQTTPGAGRNRPQDANSASRTSGCGCRCQR